LMEDLPEAPKLAK